MNIREELVALAASGRICRIERPIAEDGYEDGYVLAVGEQHFALEPFREFRSDGVSMYRIDDVVRASAREDEFFERVIDAEGLRCELPPLETLGSFHALLAWAWKNGELVIAEEESESEEDRYYWLGGITDVDSNFAELRYMDSKGHWDPEPCDLAIDELTHLQVYAPYCAMFAKYGEVFPVQESTKGQS